MKLRAYLVDDEPLAIALSEAAQKLLRTVQRSEWHLVEALSQELAARLEAAEKAGWLDESTVTRVVVQQWQPSWLG